jgi:hypothetical protein
MQCVGAAPRALIQEPAPGQPALMQPICIHHGGVHIVVPEVLVDRPNSVALLEKLSRQTMPKGMATDAIVESTAYPASLSAFCRALSRR